MPVYVVEAVGLQRLKIGFSRTLEGVAERVERVHHSCPVDVRLIAVHPTATIHDERKLHHAFRHVRIKREWFAGCQELYALGCEFPPSAGITSSVKNFARDKARRARSSADRCAHCSASPETGKTMCRKHLDIQARAQKRFRDKRRQHVLEEARTSLRAV